MRMREVYVTLAVIGVLALLALYAFPHRIANAYEDAMMMLDPSVERAYAYGDRHFNAFDPDEYDVRRAERFFRMAAEMERTYPGVQHQLARIEFLRSDFPRAIVHINNEIEAHGDANPNAYYIRALIRGYLKDYMSAAADYEKFFEITPASWAAINDYAWVLLKADLPEGAIQALEWGLIEWPENPWLLHNYAIALYELGRYDEAALASERAAARVDTLTEIDWLVAYPGNDPRIARRGLEAFRASVRENQEKIEKARAGE